MSNYIYYKVSDEITYPFPIFNGAAVDVWEYWDCDYLFMMGLKITPFSKSFVFHEEGQLPDPAPPPTNQSKPPPQGNRCHRISVELWPKKEIYLPYSFNQSVH